MVNMNNKKNNRKQRKEEKEKVNKISNLKLMTLINKNSVITFIVVMLILGAIIFGLVYNIRKGYTPQETADNKKENVNYIWGEIKPGKKNENNYTMVTSADGIEVPVPTGYTASSVESERYVNGTYEVETKKWYLTDVTNTLRSSGKYPWSKNSSGIWESGNYHKANSTSEMITGNFAIGASGGKVKINWAVKSTSEQYGILYGQIINTSTGIVVATTDKLSGIGIISGAPNLRCIDTEIELEQGTYQLKIIYEKIDSGNTVLDNAYVKKVEIYTTDNIGNGTEITEEAPKKMQKSGFVIYEGTEAVTDSNKWNAQCDRNQYVWIPIADVSDMYWRDQTTGKKYGTWYNFDESATTYAKGANHSYEPQTTQYDKQSTYLTRYLNRMSREDFLMEMEIDFDKMLNSVATYGGFYIGRYETGDLSQATPVIKRINTDINNQNWYTMWKKARKLSGTSAGVQMIWGIQWDETLKWLIDTGEKTYAEIASDSTSWGNYRNNSFTYYTDTSKSTATKASNSETRIPSGAYEGANANNVFDLAGNVSDWTAESGGSGTGFARCKRGGKYRSSYYNQAYERDNDYSAPARDSTVGLRCSLYIK